ncbi:MAG: N-acetyltransferase [Deltaproteobacteria bacterium]|nr:N-acetyltransferase [Deltaproteobacteria bacterium]MBW1861709.1 N-acetyltransferase [Deltaproteobacteria bacterium]
MDGNRSNISIAGLGPMAVLPDWQNKGIGSRLVEEGLKQCKGSGYEVVVLLGHSNYYPRFGFLPSVNYGIRSEYDVPAEVFMIKEFQDEALNDCYGIVRYHQATIPGTRRLISSRL